MSNCPSCGKKNTVTPQDILVALFVECGARTNRSFEFCHCSPNTKPPKYISGNWLTEKRAEAKGNIWRRIWSKHNEPQMKDCRDLNYKYAIAGDRIICQAQGSYYDITEEV